ncbi:hypothetical protein HDU87_008765 [Geranomyces variabilis]|uniref:Uncharacterized protein n=1 Tax=Geranomyces variabilis TaxID=109894 RepID=A0AAD5TCX6_9FUNG|nr:hypothetical protein HDU87_008765 [Geranomyces variabilis]
MLSVLQLRADEKPARRGDKMPECETAVSDEDGDSGVSVESDDSLSLCNDDSREDEHIDKLIRELFAESSASGEKKLDEYMGQVINDFLQPKAETQTPIYASQPQDETGLSTLEQTTVPRTPQVGEGQVFEYMSHLKTHVVDKSTRVSAPSMIGHMTTSLPFFHRPLARLVTALHQNTVKVETSSTTSNLERQTIAMLHREFYGHPETFYEEQALNPSKCLGIFCSGGTIANISAMWIARNKALPATDDFAGVHKAGLLSAMKYYGYDGAVVIGSAMLHYSFKKAIDLLGLGDDQLCLIPTDDQFRMRADLLEAQIKKFQRDNILIIAVVAVCGTTETGSIDPLSEIGQLCEQHKIHFHVDGAWGGPIVFAEKYRHLVSGLQCADTITIDGHKQLYTPMGLGTLLMKDSATIKHVMKTANYVIRATSSDLGKYTLEGSRPAAAMYLHAVLHILGTRGIGALIARGCSLTRRMAQHISDDSSGSFQTLHMPQTNILLYRYIPTDLRHRANFSEQEDARIGWFTREIQNAQAALNDGPSTISTPSSSSPSSSNEEQEEDSERCEEATILRGGFVSRTTVVTTQRRHKDAFRVVIANPLTQWENILATLEAQKLLGARLEAKETKLPLVGR